MIGNLDEYAPCICGSGKKYRFCCKDRMNAFMHGESWGEFAQRSPEEDDEWKRIVVKVNELIKQESPVEASEMLKDNMNYDMENSSLLCFLLGRCLKRNGQYKSAFELLINAIRRCHRLDACTLALLAELHYQMGNESMAMNAVLIAANLNELDPISAPLICEVMSLLKMHKNIIDFLLSFDYERYEGRSSILLHYLGAAAANIGDKKMALFFLKLVEGGISYQFAKETLASLEKGEEPSGMYGNWPYPIPENLIEEMRLTLVNPSMRNTYWFAELCRHLIELRQTDEDVSLLAMIDHPRATEILKRILEWPLAMEKTKNMAQAIVDRQFIIYNTMGNETKLGVPTLDEMIQKMDNNSEDDEYDDNDEFDSKNGNGVFLSMINNKFSDYDKPRVIDEDDLIKNGISPVGYPKVIDNSCRHCRIDISNPVFDKFFETYKNICSGRYKAEEVIEKLLGLLKDAPKADVISNMLAYSLRMLGRNEEAEQVLLRIIEENPSYLFAQSTLLDLYRDTKEAEKGVRLIESTVIPEEINQNLVISYWCSAARFCMAMWQEDIAEEYLKKAEYIDYDDHMCEMTRGFIEKYKKIRPAMHKFLQEMMPNCKIDEVKMISPDELLDKDTKFIKITVTEEQLKTILDNAE